MLAMLTDTCRQCQPQRRQACHQPMQATANHSAAASSMSAGPNTTWRATPRGLWQELCQRQRSLAMFGLLMLLLAVITLLPMAMDTRTLRGVGIWAKPMKFMLSTALFAWTTAWFCGWLPAALRATPGHRLLVAVLIASSTFEVAYISLQAALGSASHYNVGDPLHAALFVAMALAAVALTGTQAVLGWQIGRHALRPWPVAVWGVVAGLVLTFLLATASGFMLGGRQAPAGVGLPLVGWHLGGGDTRPAHFLGVHAQQFIPLTGLALQRWAGAWAGPGLVVFITGYVVAWALLAGWGLQR